MSNRKSPNSMSWNITAETVFTEEVDFHSLDQSFAILEEYDEEDDVWTPCLREIRLTLITPPEDDEA